MMDSNCKVTVNGNYDFQEYWRTKELGPKAPRMDLRHWWETDRLSEIEEIYFDTIRNARSLLDVGAGNLRIKNKFVRAGFKGRYHTMDVGPEFDYTYRKLEEISQTYDAILCLDVIEHLTLADGLAMLKRLVGLLEPNGVIIIGTPNARSIRNPLAMDFTHIQCYNAVDLWAYLTVLGLDVSGFRLVFCRPPRSIRERLRYTVQAFVAARLLGADYADGLAMIGRKVSPLSIR
jgi:hypothetical protein